MPGPQIDLSIYPNEADLLAALQRGENDACTCLVKQFANRLYHPVLRIVQDTDTAETVIQSAFIKACQKMDTFEARSQLGTWLHRIAINEALMLRRKEQGDPALLPDTAEPLAPDHSADPATAALGQELQAQLQQAIDALPEGYRQVFLLRDLWGLSVKETADRLDLGESAVKVRLHRARQQLRQNLASYLHAS